jgi:hypothetical protein
MAVTKIKVWLIFTPDKRLYFSTTAWSDPRYDIDNEKDTWQARGYTVVEVEVEV